MKRTFRWDRLAKIIAYILGLTAVIFIPYGATYHYNPFNMFDTTASVFTILEGSSDSGIIIWNALNIWFDGACRIILTALIACVLACIIYMCAHLIGWLTEPKDKT